jgi:glycerophosphoryl diester phosphodiesterase
MRFLAILHYHKFVPYTLYHMIIIGHRGAAGLAPENTIASIEAAAAEGVDMVEFDIRVTKDNELILFHDANLLRICGINKNINELSLEEVNITATHSGHPIPGLLEAIEAAGDIPVLIDCKGKGWAELLFKALKSHKGPTPAVTSSDTEEMFRFKELRPDIETYISELTRPFDGIYKARLLGFSGISLNFWVLNPLAYRYARRNGLKFMIFTVNRPFLARFLHLLYPTAAIITNVPHRLSPLAKRRNEKSKGSA